MNRREFIGIAATGAACTLHPALVGASELEPISVLANPRLLNVLRNERIVQILGERYRETVPGEDSVEALVEAIRSVVQSDAGTHPDTPLETRVDEQVRRDFAAGRTVTLNGWILSLIEARQCALHSLVAR
jgi:hypothetical protein